MFLKDLKEIPGLENCFVLEPEHSLQKIRKLEQKYGMTFMDTFLEKYILKYRQYRWLSKCCRVQRLHSGKSESQKCEVLLES